MVIKASHILQFQSNSLWAHILLWRILKWNSFFIIKKRSLKFWQHKFGKSLLWTGYYISRCKIDFVKENRKLILTYIIFVFIYTWLWGISPKDTCWTLHSILPKNLSSFVKCSIYEIFRHAVVRQIRLGCNCTIGCCIDIRENCCNTLWIQIK